MSHRNPGKFNVLNCACVIAVAGGSDPSTAGSSHAQDGEARPAGKGKISRVRRQPLGWPLRPNVDKSYGAIDGSRLHGYVEELAAISEKYRDAGNQWWGRIPGMPSGTESQNWVKEKFREIGVPTEIVTIPDPRDLPKSWEVSVSANGKTLKLESSDPIIDFPNFVTSPQGNEELDTVWVGLGQPADYIGKDVRGKAVFIYSIPTPSNLIQSAMWMGSVGRAQRAGAKAIIIDIAIPGNMHYVSHMEGGRARDIKIPMFTTHTDDRHASADLIPPATIHS